MHISLFLQVKKDNVEVRGGTTLMAGGSNEPLAPEEQYIYIYIYSVF